MVPAIYHNNNNYNVVSDSNSHSNDEKLFDKDVNKEVKASPKTTVNAKWYMQ